jgi:hypothetical protein
MEDWGKASLFGRIVQTPEGPPEHLRLQLHAHASADIDTHLEQVLNLLDAMDRLRGRLYIELVEALEHVQLEPTHPGARGFRMRRWGSRPGPATIRSASTQSLDCSAVALACTVQGPMTTSEKHYNGFGATLVRLAAVDVDSLRS